MGADYRISAANFLEAALVVDNRGDAVASREVDRLTLEQAQLARQAYRDYGKGRHPAGLNFGDCLAYALAKVFDEPLLFKGGDAIAPA